MAWTIATIILESGKEAAFYRELLTHVKPDDDHQIVPPDHGPWYHGPVANLR